MRLKDNMSSIIINTPIVSVNIDNKYYTNNFLKPNRTIIPSMGMLSSSTKVDQHPLPSYTHYKNSQCRHTHLLLKSDPRRPQGPRGYLSSLINFRRCQDDFLAPDKL